MLTINGTVAYVPNTVLLPLFHQSACLASIIQLNTMHVNRPASATRSPRKTQNFSSLLFESSLVRKTTPVVPRDPSEWLRRLAEKYTMARENEVEKVCGKSVRAGKTLLEVAAWAMASENEKGNVQMHTFLRKVEMGVSSLAGAIIASIALRRTVG